MKNYLKHLFIPHKENDYKPHILREFCVIVMLFVVLFTFAGSIILPSFLSQKSFLASIYSAVIVDLTNENRVEKNLTPLVLNSVLSEAASLKAQDMAEKGYFAHNSPSGITPWYWFTKAGYQFVYAGENLAIDFNDSKDVENAWMNSPGHRANILNGHFTDIGVGIAKGIYRGKETVFVVQMFGSQASPNLNSPKVIVVSKPSVSAVTSNVVTASNSKEITMANDTFIEVKNVKGEFVEPVTSSVNTFQNSPTKYSFWYERFLVNPSHTVRIIYFSLACLVILSLLFYIGIEWRIQHPKNIIYGLLLLLIILIAIYIQRSLFLQDILVL